jgi:MFS family permease
MLQEDQKKIADGVVKVFCISIFWAYMCVLSLPIFFPMMASKYDVPGTLIGFMLATPSLITIATIPLINKNIAKVGIEESILYSSIFFALSNCTMAFANFCSKKESFLWIVFFSSLLFGLSAASLTVGESALLLRYSRKEDREKNLGLFRAATGLGGLVSPLLGASMYALGGYWLIFIVNGLGCFLVAPFVFF